MRHAAITASLSPHQSPSLKNSYHPAFGLSGERDPRFTFLKDINAALSSMDLVSSMRPETREGLLDEVRAELRVLHESHHSAECRSGIFKIHGNRTSLTFVPAAQHDLLALTLEIVTRDSVTGAASSTGCVPRTELETSVETAHSGGRGVETTKIMVDALRPVTEKLLPLQHTA
jgi:hypothetical protein